MIDRVIVTDSKSAFVAQRSDVVDIIIVNWNAGDQLKTCLESVAQHGAGMVRSVVVVDNGSTDGSADVDIPGLPLTIIKAGTNLGFGRACNVGAELADAPLLLFLNPDAALLPDALPRAVAFLNSDAGSNVGALGVRLVDESGRVQHHTTNHVTPRTMFIHEQRATQFDHLSSRYVGHVIGAFYLVRTSTFRQLAGFDERFFVYLEDVDLSKRIDEAGWNIYYLAEAIAFHKGGGTSDKVKARRLFYSLRSRIIYSFKHFNTSQAVIIAIVTFIIEPVLRLGRAARRRSRDEALETLSAFRSLYLDLPALIQVVYYGRRRD